MNQNMLRRLPSNVADQVAGDESFRAGVKERVALPDDIEPLAREYGGSVQPVYVDRLLGVLEELDARYPGETIPAASDGWLASRLHSSLRLTRQEAADPRLWNYLAVAVRPSYVRRRFMYEDKETGEPTTAVNRFVGKDRRKQGFARLWWGAELFRDGPDYQSVEGAFAMQDIPNGLMGYDCFENRALAIGSVRELGKWNDGSPATSKHVKFFGRYVNLWLSTTSLDALAPDTNTDPARVWDWVTDTTPVPVSFDRLPEGPDDGSVEEESLLAARRLVRRIASRYQGVTTDGLVSRTGA